MVTFVITKNGHNTIKFGQFREIRKNALTSLLLNLLRFLFREIQVNVICDRFEGCHRKTFSYSVSILFRKNYSNTREATSNQHTRQTTTYKYLTTNLCFVPVPFVVYYALCFGSCSSYHYMFSSSPSGKKSLKKKAVLLVELAWGSSTNQERSK